MRHIASFLVILLVQISFLITSIQSYSVSNDDPYSDEIIRAEEFPFFKKSESGRPRQAKRLVDLMIPEPSRIVETIVPAPPELQIQQNHKKKTEPVDLNIAENKIIEVTTPAISDIESILKWSDDIPRTGQRVSSKAEKRTLIKVVRRRVGQVNNSEESKEMNKSKKSPPVFKGKIPRVRKSMTKSVRIVVGGKPSVSEAKMGKAFGTTRARSTVAPPTTTTAKPIKSTTIAAKVTKTQQVLNAVPEMKKTTAWPRKIKRFTPEYKMPISTLKNNWNVDTKRFDSGVTMAPSRKNARSSMKKAYKITGTESTKISSLLVQDPYVYKSKKVDIKADKIESRRLNQTPRRKEVKSKRQKNFDSTKSSLAIKNNNRLNLRSGNHIFSPTPLTKTVGKINLNDFKKFPLNQRDKKRRFRSTTPWPDKNVATQKENGIIHNYRPPVGILLQQQGQPNDIHISDKIVSPKKNMNNNIDTLLAPHLQFRVDPITTHYNQVNNIPEKETDTAEISNYASNDAGRTGLQNEKIQEQSSPQKRSQYVYQYNPGRLRYEIKPTTTTYPNHSPHQQQFFPDDLKLHSPDIKDSHFPAIMQHLTTYSKTLPRPNLREGRSDLIVDFGAASGDKGAFGWYSDHPVGRGW